MEVKFGVFTPPRGLEWIYKTAELAENGNYDSVWMPDHLVGWGRKPDTLDPWTTIASMMVKYRRVKFGVGVTDPHRRHPAVLAHQAMTLDSVSSGRFIVGIGAGEAMNLAPYGISYEKATQKLEEFLTVVKALWMQDKVNFKGLFYELKDAFILPKPSGIPIFVAGNSPKTMVITAKLGDGWIPFKMSPEVYRKNLEKIRGIARSIGRNPDEITPSILLYTAISRDKDYARRIVEEQGKILLAISPRRLKELGYKPPTEKLDAHKTVFSLEILPELEKVKEVPFEALEKSFVYGNAEDCIEGIKKFIDAGCRYFILGVLNPGPERDEAIKTYSEKVIQYFKEES